MGQTDPEWELGGWGAGVKAGTQNQRGRGDGRTVRAGQREARRSGSRRPDSGLWAPSSASGWRVAWSGASPLLQPRGVSRWPFLLVPTYPPLSWAASPAPTWRPPLHPGMHSFRGRGARRGGPDGSSPRSLGHGGRAPITLMSGWARGDQTVGRRTSASLSLAAVGFFPPVAASAWVRGLVRVCLLSHPPRVEEWELGKARCAFSLGGGGWLRVPWGIPPKADCCLAPSPRLGWFPQAGCRHQAGSPPGASVNRTGGGWSGVVRTGAPPPTSTDRGLRSQLSLGDMGSPTAGGARGSQRL